MNQPTTDIALMASEALAKATTPEAIQPIIEKQISDSVKHAVESATRSYSKFGKELEKKIEEAIGLNDLDLPTYNTLICGIVQQVVDQNVADLVNGRLKSDLEDLLSIAPKTIKLSEIVKWMTDRHEGEGYGEVVPCEVRDKERYSDSELWGPCWEVFLDEDNHYSHRSIEQCEIRLIIDHGIKEDRSQSNDEIRTGTIRQMISNGSSLARTGGGGFTTSRPYGLQQRLLALYAAETVIEIDEDEVAVSVGDY